MTVPVEHSYQGNTPAVRDTGGGLTQEMLKQRVSYDPETGQFIWLIGKCAGSVAGHIDKSNGYSRINFARGKQYRSHRLAWLYMTGSWPTQHIDHINRVRSDNRFSNLRDVSVSANQLNKKVARNSSSGITGVSWSKRKKKWRFDLRAGGKRFVGFTKSREAAAAAYQELKDRLPLAVGRGLASIGGNRVDDLGRNDSTTQAGS